MIERFLDHVPEIHPEAWVHPSAVLIGEVRLHRGASVWPCAVLRGDMGLIEIGEDSNIQDGVVCHGTAGLSTTRVGPRVTVGHRAILHGCRVEGDSLIGMGSVLLDNCLIPPFCVVGAGSVVPPNKTFPARSLILGSPARVVRTLRCGDLDRIAASWRHYRDTVALRERRASGG